MSRKLAGEVLPRLRQRYAGRGREGRTRLIDEVCEQWGYGRKHAIKLPGAKAGWGGDPAARKERPPVYGQPESEVLWRIWKAAEQPCGKRLKALLPTRLPHYQREHWRLEDTLQRRVLAISAAQIDRLLAARKSRVGHRRIVEATRGVEAALPFELLGFDTDNGSEFLNWHLLRYFQDRPETVGFTRSRPYKKNDNGDVEQKNWTHVRQLLGYDRLGNPELVASVNALYRDCREPLHDFFLPSVKPELKTRDGAKVKRKHDKPLTPCERLLASPDVAAATKRQLKAQRAALNPFGLHRKLEEVLRAILHRALHSSRPTDSLHSGPDAATSSHCIMTFESTTPPPRTPPGFIYF